MAWDRNNGMYYRSHRDGKKVRREYFGQGGAARLAAALDNRKRRRKQIVLAAAKAMRRQWEAAASAMIGWQSDTCLLLRGIRLLAHSRRRRDGGPDMDAKPDDVMKELRELIELGEAGDKSVLPRVRHLLDRHAEVADHFGDAANVATELWLSLYVGDNAVLAESTRRKMLSLRASIAGPVPSPLESLMVEQVIIAWLQTNATEALEAQAHLEKASDAVLRERQRQTGASQRLYGASVKQLAELRKWLPSLPDPLPFRSPGLNVVQADHSGDPSDSSTPPDARPAG